MQRNKKATKKQRESVIYNSNQKLKKDYNYFDYLDFFTEEYKILDNECRKNLEQISKSLCEITIAKGDN